MTNITYQDVLAHQAQVPWPHLHQVEQDLLLCRAMVAIFNDKFLSGQVAMRGGTVLHKVHLAPAARYSEDIDLVLVGDHRPEAHIEKALNRVLRPLFGKEKSSVWDYLKLTVRNAARPSRILRVIYKVSSVTAPGRVLTVEVEVNVSERIPLYPLQQLPFSVRYRGADLSTVIASYHIDEILGTKLRALLQRKKGRDLFDLYWAFTAQSALPVSHQGAIAAFEHYMTEEGTRVPQAEFMDHLGTCLADPGFCSDMAPLLLAGLAYDPHVAGKYVADTLLARLDIG